MSRQQREIDFYEHHAHVWWGIKTIAGKKRYLNRTEFLKKMCSLPKNAKILEIGCGNGEFTKHLARLDARIIATDLTPILLRQSSEMFKKRGIKNVELKIEDAQKLSFKDKTFDLVCGISVLHHLDPLKALKESYRVLKDGGEIFFTEPNMLNPQTFISLRFKVLRERLEYSEDETAFTRWEIVKMLKIADFAQTKVINYDFLHPSTPKSIISIVERLGGLMEKLPIAKEVSGSLAIWAKK